MDQEIEFLDVNTVTFEEGAQGINGLVRDISCNQPDAKAIFPNQGFDERDDILVETRFLAIDLRQCGDQLRTVLFAKLLSQIFRKFLESAEILEKVPAFLETFKITDIHVVAGECPFDRREGIDGRTVCIEYQKMVLAVHSANLAIRGFSFVTAADGRKGRLSDICYKP